MTISELLFIFLVLLAAVVLLTAGAKLLRGKRAEAGKLLLRLLAGTAVYLGVVYAVAALSHPPVLGMGEPQCADDWCLVVDSAQRTHEGSQGRWDVQMNIVSRARRIAQRESIAHDVYLEDAERRRYDPVPDPAAVRLDSLLQPGESIPLIRVFVVPDGARSLRLRIDRRGGPNCLIIGECTAFHNGASVRIE